MLEFVQFVQALFPGIDPFVAAKCLEAIRQHRTLPEDLVSGPIGGEVCQGDLIEGIRLRVPTRDGGSGAITGLSMVVSNSCDLDNKPFALLAPSFDLELFRSDPRLPDISRNTVTNLFALDFVPGGISVVSDLSLIQPISTEALKHALESGSVRRVCSLSEVGWYLLLSKLTVHLMRPEDLGDAQRTRLTSQ